MAIVESNGNDVSTPMKIGDERKFVIYKKNKPNCGLFTEDDSEKVEIMIKKPRDREFHVDGYATAHIECYPGHVTQLKSRGKTEQCGIGKILMQLCLIEIDIHNVHYERNYVLGEISTFEALCKSDEACKGTPQEKVISELYDWASDRCLSMISLVMLAEPPSGAHVYFNSAFESGYTEMFIQILNNGHPQIYPKTGHGLVNEIRKQYNDGQMKDEAVTVQGGCWFFCKPKTP